MKPDPFHRAEKALLSLEQRSRYDESNRIALLVIHGVMGVVVGFLMMAYGAPDAWRQVVGPDRDWMLALPAAIGGFLLLGGLLVFNRNMLLESIGMTLILIWDCVMVFILQKFGLNPYAVAVYASMAALMGVHVFTLIRYLATRERKVR